MADKLNRLRVQLCSMAYTLCDEGRIEEHEVNRITTVIERMSMSDFERLLKDVEKLAVVA